MNAQGEKALASAQKRDSELGGSSSQWWNLAARWERSSQNLILAYRSLEKRIHDLDKALEARNKALEASLQERERLQELLVRILEGLPVGVLVWDLHGRLVRVNGTALRLLEREAWEGDGSIEGFLRSSLPENLLHRLLSCVSCGKSCYLEQRLRAKIGDNRPWIRFHGVPLKDGAGKQLGGLLTLEDLTEFKAMEEDMARRQRLAAMGEMAASIAHEVRNPLGSVQLFASLMAEEQSAEERIRMMEQIKGAIKSVDRLLCNLLNLARPLRASLQSLDPMELLRECFQFVEPLAKQKGIELLLESTDLRLEIQADRELLKQAVLNILLNSFQATDSGGTVHAWITARQQGGIAGEGDEFLEINLEDTGKGIPPEVLPRVFDPFFTTRSDGSGLGLCMVHNIMRCHGGSIWIDSEEGKGTKVKLRIPRMSLENIRE
ncbi:MAG: ATP-binding protein [bacterium]